jgi:hypothetical protein
LTGDVGRGCGDAIRALLFLKIQNWCGSLAGTTTQIRRAFERAGFVSRHSNHLAITHLAITPCLLSHAY